MFEKDAAKAGKEHKEAKIEKEKKKLEQERKEVQKKLVEKEVEVARFREAIASKQNIVIDTEKMGPNIVPPSMGTNQKVKKVVVVNQKHEGVQMKT